MAQKQKDNDKSLAPLKFMVFSLGIALIGGIILMFAMVYQRHQAKMEGTLPDKQVEASQKRCKGGDLTLNNVGRIREVKQQDNSALIIISEQAGKEKITVVDFCANRVVSTLKLVP